MRLLLVEDDRNLGKATAEGLKESFAVDWVRSAEEAEDALSTVKYDLAVFDINLPEKSGLELLKDLRRDKNKLPVLLLTARDAVYHRVEGLNSGADDYLVKPFDLDELLARCAALVRRSQSEGQPIILINDLSYEPSSGKLEKTGKSINLSGRERAVFDVLAHNINRPVSKAMIEERIYDWGSEHIESNTIEVHIAALRRKIGRENIKTIRGIGYMICV
jgi:DNA-binding response OmpR family regulator